MNQDYSEQELIRRNSLNEIAKLGIDAYPAAEFEINVATMDILDFYIPDKYNDLSIAGRIMAKRVMGNASFFELQDEYGRIQVYVKRDDLCPGEDKTMYNTFFKKLLDIGDIVGVKGYAFITQTGEKSIHCTEIILLAKSLRVLPIVKEKDGQLFDAFTDPEQRYRMRYVDLIVNAQVRETFAKRTQIINAMREYFNHRCYLEVETPVLQSIPGGATARPFITHHNALDIPLYLRIANELYLKRLIVGGFPGVYEFSRNFRNEGMDRTHNPEFTCLEIYVAYTDYRWMMTFTEKLFAEVTEVVNQSTQVCIGDHTIDFEGPYRRLPMLDAIKEYTGYDITGMDEQQLREVCAALDIKVEASMGKGKLIDAIFGEKCEHHLIQPTFIIDYPIELSPLTKKHRDNPALTERFELFVCGKEICNAYSELNDPIDQLERFKEQMKLKEKGDDEAMFIDYDFIRALEYGMPPTSGMGIGIDRFVMMLTGAASIQDVLFFPQLRPEKPVAVDKPEVYISAGIPEDWIPVVQKLGYNTLASLANLNPAKLFNDLCGINKKMKLNLKNPSPENVKDWVEKAKS
ncbi:MAG: lysine--tRNA ligase [Prevotellaceae bacterium]|jgi:lysyl-tRNA synthetase class 2|nr:lysine--tRNA ligase [Prevotellaceae bacterium]